MATGLLARLDVSGGVTEPVAHLVKPEQQLAEASLNEVLAAAMSKEVAEALPPVEEAITQSNKFVVLPEGAASDFVVEEEEVEEEGQLG